MKRSPELEAMTTADETAVSNRNAGRNQTLGMAALLLGGAVAAYFVLATANEKPRDVADSDEEFQTTTFRPPSFVRDEQKREPEPEQEVIKLPTPPEAVEETVDTTEFKVPAPPEAVEETPEAAPVEVFPERYKSGLIKLDQKGNGSGNGSLTGESDSGLSVAGEDRNSKYLAAAAGLADRSAKARQIERIDAMIPEGTLIPGILETAINSDLPGQIRAITSQDVYSFDGRRILIPTGTRLIGEYQSEVTRGQKRIFVIWTRLIRDDGVSVRLNSIGTDSLGRSGLTGHVDNKFRERFGASIMLSIVGGAASYLTGYGSQEASNNSDDAARGEEIARETIAQTFSDMANTVLSENLRIPPTISVSQGERIFVYVRQDLDFSAMYDDPVTEAMKEIQRERRGK
ncbi:MULTISPECIES: type IV secretion system protein VirB10 [Rhizobium]|uniref:type IV secretion system protein VirB10 n=1 Tax=Rhizobium TaxID=379 RepID=UPI001B31E903|nr:MULTISPECIES: type IV secretion system protein VirB10 [Rhizobium]MBX4911713.1 conjugal transfer protein TrbI [Rhizobium bangladeshense]MBX5254496.1 conjugal transfer protein TrbI [Rhizobium sp. NLR4b]MBX5260613.1 conjugal transfer protein TrbI [Rhizobium sp. NLR16b]MBX5266700.1 conjugal transfer protein TrbI [Rhizobium sp. NLR16a]MBX5297106.1 conjugal transfer protein TrbI [Rhizobium sp. NLR15a]